MGSWFCKGLAQKYLPLYLPVPVVLIPRKNQTCQFLITHLLNCLYLFLVKNSCRSSTLFWAVHFTSCYVSCLWDSGFCFCFFSVAIYWSAECYLYVRCSQKKVVHNISLSTPVVHSPSFASCSKWVKKFLDISWYIPALRIIIIWFIFLADVQCTCNVCSDLLILGHYSPIIPMGRLISLQNQSKKQFI